MDNSITRPKDLDKQHDDRHARNRDANLQKVSSTSHRGEAHVGSASTLLTEFKALNETFIKKNTTSKEVARDALTRMGILGEDGELSPNLR